MCAPLLGLCISVKINAIELNINFNLKSTAPANTYIIPAHLFVYFLKSGHGFSHFWAITVFNALLYRHYFNIKIARLLAARIILGSLNILS